MASNFSFLGKYWPELALLGETAESYLYSDPNACIFKIGMLAEQIVQGIFSYEKIELPEDTRQSNLIRVLKYRSIIPENIDNILYSIRRARNDAVHVGCESTDRARILLEMAYNLCIWYMEVYGDWSFVAAEYVEPADISSKKEFTSIIESHEEKLKELLEEINRMKTDASEKSAEERKEKAETVSNALEVSNDVQGYIQKESVRMDIEIMPFLNFALQKNKVNIVQSLIIQNDTDENLEDIDLKVKSVPEICLPYEKHIEIVPAKTTVEIKDIKLIANVIYLGNLTEKEEAYITFSLNQGEREICVDNQPISALAFDEWHGSVFYPELLTAFVTPNAPIVSALIKRASEFLKNWTSDPSLDAYQSNDAERVMKQAAAVYAALQEQNITYAVPPASFERAGQRVRLCDMVISQKLGTCLDLTLLYVSCIEAIGLHPVLVLLQGHIFAGVWLENYTFPDAILDDAAQVTKRLASGVDELIVVECTAFCSGKKFSFDEACDAANAELRDGENVQYIIDVHRARMSGITPLPSRIKTESGYSFASDDEVDYVTSAPKREISALDIESSLEGGSRTKKEMWERKLLDLSLRNKLINMSLKSVIPILTDSIDTIEDILSDGKDLYIFPRPQDWHILSKDLNFENMHDLGSNTAVIHSELENKRLRSALSESEVLTKLKGLYRSSKLSIEENGANTLYIALGLLKWYESERSRKARYAPLLLLPVEIIRKGGNQGYVIRRRDEETQMNITVLEKLNQDFQIRIAGLETLPIDEHGIDTRKTFTIIRKGIMNQPRWDVLESAYIGIFSFSQFVMWNDIKNRADDLARNKIVRSLMEGKLVWKPESMNLNEYVPANDLYLPVSVDGSQMYAVDSAAKGKSFVLHGPPGTGKSQTITVMIANALAQGKGVKATGIAGTIKAFLKNNGYESDILVGRSEFKIDVGVINPGNTENYILGIILDGDSYNAAKTTRDRELAQIAVLNGLGWNIHRIWTMDWYDNQVKELNKLLSLLDELKNTSEKKTTGGSLAVTPKTSAVPIQKNVIEKVVTAEQKKKYSAVVYESVVLSYTPMSADNMLDYHSDEIRKRITQIIQKEGPVCEKFLYKKVVQSFGVTRVGSRIQGRLEVLVGNNRDNVTKQESGKVFWPAGINPDNYYGFRASGENENKRDAKDVPVYEALNAMSYILFNDISVEEEDLIREAAKLMGYARVGTGVSTLFKTALKLGCKNGRLIKEDIRWKLTEEGNIFAKNLGSNVVCEEIVSEELNDELDDIDTTTSKLVAKNIKAKEIAKKCALDKITNCDSNCKFYFTCSHAGD